VFFRFHPLWRRMLKLALLKGLAQGYIVTAPAMLIMLLVGQEGTLGATQAIGGVFSACLMYTVWPYDSAPASHHRLFCRAPVCSFSARSPHIALHAWACSSLSDVFCWPNLSWILPIIRSSCR